MMARPPGYLTPNSLFVSRSCDGEGREREALLTTSLSRQRLRFETDRDSSVQSGNPKQYTRPVSSES